MPIEHTQEKTSHENLGLGGSVIKRTNRAMTKLVLDWIANLLLPYGDDIWNSGSPTTAGGWSRNSTWLQLRSANTATSYTTVSANDDEYTTNAIISFDKKPRFRYAAKFSPTLNLYSYIGVGDWGTLNGKIMGFEIDDTVVRAFVANGGATTFSADIGAGLTLTNYNDFEIIWESSTSVKFYINGTLKATLTTGVPTGTTEGIYEFNVQSDDAVAHFAYIKDIYLEILG